MMQLWVVAYMGEGWNIRSGSIHADSIYTLKQAYSMAYADIAGSWFFSDINNRQYCCSLYSPLNTDAKSKCVLLSSHSWWKNFRLQHPAQEDHTVLLMRLMGILFGRRHAVIFPSMYSYSDSTSTNQAHWSGPVVSLGDFQPTYRPIQYSVFALSPTETLSVTRCHSAHYRKCWVAFSDIYRDDLQFYKTVLIEPAV